MYRNGMTTTQITTGTQVTYHGTIRAFRGDVYVVSEYDPETGRYALVCPEYPDIDPLRRVRPGSIAPIPNEPILHECRCGLWWSEEGQCGPRCH
jgi:hypothetical protein